MSDTTQQRLVPRTVVAGALALGLVAGGYGVASAASGSSTTTTPTTTLPTVAPSSSGVAPQSAPQGWGQQRSDETPLTGDALAGVTAAAKAKLPGATIDRVETDAEGHAAYEAHVTKADGSLATVYVDKSFNVVSVESR
jgi:sugar (pentulose or hexulose) kinase